MVPRFLAWMRLSEDAQEGDKTWDREWVPFDHARPKGLAGGVSRKHKVKSSSVPMPLSPLGEGI